MDNRRTMTKETLLRRRVAGRVIGKERGGMRRRVLSWLARAEGEGGLLTVVYRAGHP